MSQTSNLHLLVPCDHGWRYHCGRASNTVPEGHSIPLEFFPQYQAQLCPECAQWPHPPVLAARPTPGPQLPIKARKSPSTPARRRRRTTETEKAFMKRVIEAAQQAGWRVFHVHNSRRSAPGWVDLVLAKPGHQLVLSELKTAHGKTTAAQEEWLEVLGATTGVEVHLWRPNDWTHIVELLAQEAGRKNAV